jgi:hypothetical protein
MAATLDRINLPHIAYQAKDLARLKIPDLRILPKENSEGGSQ